MVARLVLIFSPLVIGPVLFDIPEYSIAWSLAASVFIATVAQTNWFRESAYDKSFTHSLLRPGSMFHILFVSYHIIGGTIYAVNGSGHSLFGTVVSDLTYDPTFMSKCQRLMLLSHASVTAGMKLVGFGYNQPQFRLRSIPPYHLTVVSFVSLGISRTAVSFSGLGHFADTVAAISATAILVEIYMCLRYRRYGNLAVALVPLGMNLINQAVSGWKGLVLLTVLTLAALLYNLMPKRVLVVGTIFLFFWALYFYPFGLALRPLLWYKAVPQNIAVEMSINKTLSLSFEERLNVIWASFSARANDLVQFRKYIEFVPARHPYYGFDIVRNALIALIPRTFSPEKPDMEVVSMQRVYEAGVVSKQATVSAKSSFYQDAYLSGDWPVVILASLLFGFLIMVISHTCERLFGGYEIGTCLIFTGLFADAVNSPPNFLFFVGTILSSLLVMIVMFFLGKATGWILPTDNSMAPAVSHAEDLRMVTLAGEHAGRS